jgi:hypothetical protein
MITKAGGGAMTQATLPETRAELEEMVRRVVREELTALLNARRAGLNDMRHEGPADPAGDETLLAEALVVLQTYGGEPGAWLDWTDLKTELSRPEAAGDLPG